MSDSSYTGTINDLLGSNSSYNNKLIVQEGNLVYVSSEVSSQEKDWLEKLGIEKASDYYTVEFDSAGGTEISSQTIKTGTLVKKPSNPIKTGHDFLGWYYLKQSGREDNPTYTEIEFDFDTKITSNYLLYAKYTGDAVMMARNNNYAFWQADIRTNITNIVFTDDDSLIPDNAEYSWDIRADKVNGGTLMAYLSNGENLIIYSPHIIYANVNAKEYFSNFTKVISVTFDNFDTSKVTTMFSMFYNCSQLINMDISQFNTRKVINMQYMFYNCSKLTSINVSIFNTEKVETMYSMFYNCSELTGIDMENFDTSNVKNMHGMFNNCNKLTSIDVSNFDTGKVTDMFAMFCNCSQLTSIDVSNFDTGKVTNMQYMFYNCSRLTSIDVSNFNTGKVTNMFAMFQGCRNLAIIDVSKFNTSKVTTMYAMFWDCNKLTNIDVSNFDTSNVTNMFAMFCNCNQLTSIDVSNFNTSKVTNMQSMFQGCNKLNELNLKNWKVSNLEKVTSKTYMFLGIPKTVCIYVDDIDMKNWLLNLRSDFENIKVNEL